MVAKKPVKKSGKKVAVKKGVKRSKKGLGRSYGY